MQRVGILGGTFDPPHLGHLVLAEYAQEALDLERVLFVPAADPPHKRGIDRPGPHYAVDMIRLLQTDLPDSEVYFLMGSDSFNDLPRWHRPADLIQACRIVVLDRPGRGWAPTMHDEILPDLADRTVTLGYPRLGISSTEVSRRLDAGLSVRYLVPQPVLQYIAEHGLYKHAREHTAT